MTLLFIYQSENENNDNGLLDRKMFLTRFVFDVSAREPAPTALEYGISPCLWFDILRVLFALARSHDHQPGRPLLIIDSMLFIPERLPRPPVRLPRPHLEDNDLQCVTPPRNSPPLCRPFWGGGGLLRGV